MDTKKSIVILLCLSLALGDELSDSSPSIKSVLAIFRPFSNSFLYNSASRIFVEYSDVIPQRCVCIDLIANYSSPTEHSRIIDKLKTFKEQVNLKLCPFLLYRDGDGQFVRDIIEKNANSISMTFVVNDTTSTKEMKLPQSPLTVLSVDDFTVHYYKKVRQKDLTWNYFDFLAYKDPERTSICVKLSLITLIVMTVYLISLVSIHVRRVEIAKKLSQAVKVTTKKKNAWDCFFLVLMIGTGVGILLLMYFFYDIFVYFFVAFFMIEIIASGNFYTDFIAKLIVGNDHYLTRPRFWTISIIKIFGAITFLFISIFWVLVRRYNPIGPQVETVLSIMILSFLLIPNIHEIPFRSSAFLFLYLIIYDIIMVYVSPYWNLTAKIAGPFAALGEVSIMESVASGLSGLSGENLPLLFRIKMNYLDNDLILGFGDVIIPGFMIAGLMFYDCLWEIRFHMHAVFSLIGYQIGLIICMVVATYFRSGQPALLFICPLTFGSVVLGTMITNRTIFTSMEYSLRSLWYNMVKNAPLMQMYSEMEDEEEDGNIPPTSALPVECSDVKDQLKA